MRQPEKNGGAKAGLVAIVGMGCRFPGARNVREMWELLVEGRDAIGTYPGDRFPQVDAFLAEAAASGDNAAMAAGGFLPDIDKFDAAAFELSPREATYIDPQHRLLLECAWAALEDAGQPRQDPKTRNTGVFVGLWASDFENVLYGSGADLEFYAMTGSGSYGASGRLSFTFGFEGPSVSVDAACSSSLVAVHLGCQSLLSGECDMALAGGANAILSTDSTKMFTKAGMLARDGHCKFGSADADGFVRSEGAGMVVLKRLEDALEAGDPIHAVIRGGAVSNDGRTSGTLMTPSREGQRQTLHRAWAAAGVSGREIKFFEAHGTGTSVGDPVEVGAIADALNDDEATDPSWIGSIKSNIGHTESAAGIAGLIKTVLALKHRVVPKSRLTGAANPKIEWKAAPLRLLTEPLDLSGEETAVIAGVSSFALTGTNAHLVIQEFRHETSSRQQTVGPFLIPVSARSDAALDELLARYETHVTGAGDIRDLAHTASLRRRHDEYRAAIVCDSLEGLNEAAAAARRDRLLTATGAVKDGKQRVVFIAPGQGSQWAGMARELYAEEPVFKEMLERCDAAIRLETGWSVIELLLGADTEAALKEIDVVQPALFSLSVSLAELWKSWGIVPDAVIGHSMGEVAAAYIAGALSLEDAVAVICRRSRLMKTIRGAGAMMTVELPEKAVEGLLREVGGDISVAAGNSPETTIVAGDTESITRLESMLVEREVFCRRVKVDVASHSAQVDPILDHLREALRDVAPMICKIPLFSTVTGGYLTGGEMDAEYWAANLRRPVRYAKGTEALLRDGCDVFVELSPHPVLIAGTEATIKSAGKDAIAVASMRRDKPERREMLASLGALYQCGCDVAWESFYTGPERCVTLPEYPFQRERCWPELDELKVGARGKQAGGGASHPLLGRKFEPAMQPDTVIWEIVADVTALPYLRDHLVHGTVVLPAAAQVEIVLEALRAEEPGGLFSITSMRFDSAIDIPEDAGRELQLGLRREDGQYAFEIFGRRAATTEHWTRHCSGVAEQREAITTAVQLDLLALMRASVRHFDKTHHYRLRTRAGIGYGPAFQLVEEAWCGKGESLLRIGAVVEGRPVGQTYVMHPALLDNCFQALQLAQPDGEGFLFDDTSLPVSIERVEMFGRMPATGDLFCHARVINANADTGTLRGDLTLSDASGVVFGVVNGFTVKRVSGNLEERAGELLTEIAWEPYEVPELKEAMREGIVVVFCDSAGVGVALADQIRTTGGRAVLVRQGTQFSVRENGSHGREYGASPDRAEDVQRIFADFVLHGEKPVSVVYLWALSLSRVEEGGVEAALAAQTAGACFIPWLTQAISACDWSAPPRLWMVTGGCMVPEGAGSQPELTGASLWGIGAVAAVEHPELQASLVDLSAERGRDEIDGLVRLISSGTDEDRIAMRGKRMFVERFVPAVTSPALEKTSLFRKDATYVIAGGMGGVGSTVAEWMAVNGAGCLVLISRRAESDETRDILRRIEALGARAVHAMTDIVDRDAVQHLFVELRREMPPIAGVMQAATVIDDALLADLTPSRFNAVMGPKVKGTWNLYDATAEDKLDFMVLFSSIASVYPQPGHGSYAAANAFMDSFARWARSAGRKVTSINWGGWEQIGLARETGTGRSISGYAQQGFETMSGARALSALKRAIENNVVQAIASPIDVEQAAEFFGDGRVPPVLRQLLAKVSSAKNGDFSTAVQTKLSHSESRTDSLRILQEYLIEELSRVLKMVPERISGDTLFGSIGLDSLMTLELVRRLKAGLGFAIPTTAVFNCPTAALLSREIVRRMQLHPEDSSSAEAQSNANATTARSMAAALVAEDTSDEDALQALMQPAGTR